MKRGGPIKRKTPLRAKPRRIGVHYDTAPHASCPDPKRCSCRCEACCSAYERRRAEVFIASATVQRVSSLPDGRRVHMIDRAVAQPKRGLMLSETLRSYIRRECACYLVGERCAGPACEPHHQPTVGALGGTCDLLCVATCRACHEDAHAGRISRERVAVATWEMWVVLARHYPAELRQILRELAG